MIKFFIEIIEIDNKIIRIINKRSSKHMVYKYKNIETNII